MALITFVITVVFVVFLRATRNAGISERVKVSFSLARFAVISVGTSTG